MQLARRLPSSSSRSPRRVVTRAAQTAVLASLVGGAAAFTTLDSTVTVSVDGVPQQVHTYAGTVGGALERAGLTVGEHDVVVPAAGSELRDGQQIVLDRGRQVELTVDGRTRRVWVTSRSVGELLGDLKLRAAGAALSSDRSTRIPLSGLEVSLRLPKTVTITVDGGSRSVSTTATSVRALLAEQSVALGPLDLVSVDPSTVPSEGLTVAVTRIVSTQDSADTAIPFGTERRADSSLYVGTEKQVQAGADGLRRRVFRVTLRDGVEVGRTVLSVTDVRQPTPRVVAYGTRAKPAPKPVVAKPAPRPAPTRTAAPAAPRRSTSGVDSLNWGALAQCESGGDPKAYNPNGYYGLYQFSLGTWRSVGGSGKPTDASPSEQTYRAKLLYQREGDSPWPVCGSRLYR